MSLLTLWGRPERPAPGHRTRLSVQALDDRAAPSSLLATEDDRRAEAAWDEAAAYLSPSGGPTASMMPVGGVGDRGPTNQPPQIVDFAVVRLDTGRYQFTGRVIDEAPGGLAVTFGGVPTAVGQTTTTNADGTFSLTLQMQTDGSDMGTVTAVTQDVVGLWSNTAGVWVDPR
jgi:hypothetical protein